MCVTRGVCAVCRVCYVRTQVGTGLLTYPVLMAADILLYRAALVPANCIMIDHFLHLNWDWSPRFSRCVIKTAGFEPKRPEI